ncbi:glycosyltransferase [Variovorax guangxiensis]|uniref:Glycosyltransferase n=1 Tax=Variovorax guangxiensis TaxID=1775474 RepID=A0A3S0XDN8_9BURK|nr:class I SAM-dependent methyltransferase [Variovorax guangxiensis]RUR67415.1 glycosyltransferase [Variovorax guangxiensis]
MLELDFSVALKNIDIAPQPSAWIGHIPFGVWIVESIKPRVIVELGTHYGHSYFSFCQAVEHARLSTKCYAVDLWKGDEHAGLYGEEVYASVTSGNSRFEEFSRLLRMTFDDAASYFSDGSVDLLHIDGLHTYEAVKHDFETWRPKLSQQGLVLFHDINVRERDFGVWRLWEELSRSYPTIEFMHSHGLGVLFYGAAQSPAAKSLFQSFGTESGRTYIVRLFGVLGRKLELDRQIADMSSAMSKYMDAEAVLKNELAMRDNKINELFAQNAEVMRRLEVAESERTAFESRIADMYGRLNYFENQGELNRLKQAKWKDEQIILRSQLAQALQREAVLNASMREILASTSWKVSRPVRWAGARVANIRSVRRLFGPASKAAGGPLSLVRTVSKVIMQEGISGLKRRIVAFDQSGYAARLFAVPTPGQARIHYTLDRRSATVDVIVCVHNALSDVQNCLSSVVAHTLPPYRIIVVDDGSDEETKNYLNEFIREQGGVLVRHDVAQGYTFAANAGLRASNGQFVVLLNSDTVVSAQWLDRMVECANSDARIGMVGPLSNTASWQSIPKIFDEHGDWSSNPLPPEMTVSEMAKRVIMASRRTYPRVGFLNGFCLLIRREQLSDVGLFDEENFGKGYGEENDLCIRAVANGWQLAIADDVYVFHAQSKSYSTERRIKLAKAADENLHRKHSSAPIMNQLEITRQSLRLRAVRSRLQLMDERLHIRAQIRQHFEGKRILIILPVAHAGGGAHVILSEASVLQDCGVDVVIANSESARASFEASYPGCRLPITWLSDWSQLSEHIHFYDAVVATLYLSVFWIKEALEKSSRRPTVGYYIQDFEPDFFADGSADYLQALASYTEIPMRLMTKTEWNRKMVAERTGKSPILLGPSLDWSRFAPPPIQRSSRQVIVCAMIRSSTPRRAPQMTVSVLRQLLIARPNKVQVRTFGCEPDDAILDPLRSLSSHQAYGELSSAEVDALMKQADVFVDLSVYQAMGLSCLEAMASGVTIIGPVNGGLSEIVTHEETGLLVDTRDEAQCLQACLRLVDDSALRRRLGDAGIERAAFFFPDAPALAMGRTLFSESAEKRPHQ